MNRTPASKQGSLLRLLPRASPTPRWGAASPSVHSMSTSKSSTASSRGQSPRPATGFSSRLVSQFLRVNKKKQPKHQQLRRRSRTDVIAVIITLKYLMRDKLNKNGCFSSKTLLKLLLQLDMDDAFAFRFASALATCQVIELVDGTTEAASLGPRAFDNSKRQYWRWAQWASIAEIGAVSTCSAEIIEGNILGDVDLCIQYPNLNVEHEDFCLFFRINTLSDVSIRGKQLFFSFDEPMKPLHHDKWRFELLDNFEFLETLQNLLRFWEPIQHMEALLAECEQPLFIRPCTPAAAARHRHASLHSCGSTSRSCSRAGSQAQDLNLWRCPPTSSPSSSSLPAPASDQKRQEKRHRGSGETELHPIAAPSAGQPRQQQQQQPTSGSASALSASSSSFSSLFQPISTSRGSPAVAEDRTPSSPLAHRTTSSSSPVPAPPAAVDSSAVCPSGTGSHASPPVSTSPSSRPSRLSTSTGSQGEGVPSSPLARGPRVSKTTGTGLALPPRLSATGHGAELDVEAARRSPKGSINLCPSEYSPLHSTRSSIASSRSSAVNVFESYPPTSHHIHQQQQQRPTQAAPMHYHAHHHPRDRRASSLRETVRDFSRNGTGVRSASPPIFATRASSLHSQSPSAERAQRRRGYTITHCGSSAHLGGRGAVGGDARSDHIYEELSNFQDNEASQQQQQQQSDGMGAFSPLHRVCDRRSLDTGSSSPGASAHVQPRLSLDDPIARERHRSWRVHGGRWHQQQQHQQMHGDRHPPSRSLDACHTEHERRRASEGADGRGREFSRGSRYHACSHQRRSLRSSGRLSASSSITTFEVGGADMSRATVSASRAANDPPPPPPPPRPAHLKPLPPHSHIYDNTRPHERAKQLQDAAARGGDTGITGDSPTTPTAATVKARGGESDGSGNQEQDKGTVTPLSSATTHGEGAGAPSVFFNGSRTPTPPPMGSPTAAPSTTALNSASTITATPTPGARQTPPAQLHAACAEERHPQQQQQQEQEGQAQRQQQQQQEEEEEHTYISLSELSDATVYVV